MLSAIVLGILLYVLGGGYGLFFIAVMIWFLVISALVTVAGKGQKKLLGVYQRKRSWRNVVANGLVPLAVVIAFWLNSSMHFIEPVALVVGYVASVGALAADKFSSEIGVLSRIKPVMLVTLKSTKTGTSGGITALGLFAGLVGALLISMFLINFSGFPTYMVVVVASGLVGTLVDSVFGYFEELGFGNKFTSNFVGSLAGLLFCLIVIVFA